MALLVGVKKADLATLLRRSTPVVILLALVMLAPAMAEEPPIKFEGDDTIAIEPGTKQALTILNNTGMSLTIQTRALDESGNETTALTVGDPSARIAPGGVATVTVTAAATSRDTKGFLVALATRGPLAASPAAVARRRFVITPKTTRLEPLVSKWNMTSYRWKPGNRDFHNAVIPIKATTECPPNPSRMAVGGVASSSGGAAMVTAQCTETGVSPGPVGVRLTFLGLGHNTGDYTGTLDLVPDDDKKGAVELSVRRTDFVLLPMLVLVAGIGLAMVAARQAGRLSALSEAEEETWLLQSEAAAAERAFRDKARGTTWSSYTLEPQLTNALAGIRAQLKELGMGFSKLDKENPRYKALLDKLRGLRKTISAWPAFADRLAALDTALATVRSVAPMYRPGDVDKPVPAFTELVARLLLGKAISPDDALDCMEKVEAMAKLSQEWPVQAKAALALDERAERIEGALPSDYRENRAGLNAARNKIGEARREMWRAKDANEYRELAVTTDLGAAQSTLDGLSRFLETFVPMGPEEAAVAPGEQLRRAPSALEGILTERAATPSEIARAIAAQRRLRNVLVFLSLAVVTLWTGLTTLYFNKPFGTARDYLTLLAWGFGAQAGLEALATAVDRVIARGRTTVA